MHSPALSEIAFVDVDDDVMDFAASVRAVEDLLNYRFEDVRLLEEALTHSSYTESASYQRLEFVGDAALGLAISNFFFLAYPDVDPGQLSLLRAANISTEKLARAAVRHGLYRYVRHNTVGLDQKVRDFVLAVQHEDETASVYGGSMKAPKVLADIVESVAAAVYVDLKFNLQNLWVIFRGILEPIVTLDVLQQQPQPVTMLFELCQKEGKYIDIRHWRNGEKNIASVYIEGTLIASASSDQKENAKLHAAKAALQKLSSFKAIDNGVGFSNETNGTMDIEGAKQKLHELCCRKKWQKPHYSVVREVGPSHERRFICSVQVETAANILAVQGDEKSRVKDAENSAASMMLRSLLESKSYL